MKIATKDEERKALEQIRTIIDGLGESSYIGMAFEGCFEVAADNIENDWGCSLKQEADSARKELEKLSAVYDEYVQKKSAEIDELKNRLDAMTAARDAAFKESARNAEEAKAIETKWKESLKAIADQDKELVEMCHERDKLADEIIHLKAKLYDLIVK